VEVNARDNQGATPFFVASESGNPDLVRLLLDHNADVHAHDKRGVTPLHKAAAKGRHEVTRMLLE
jgi:ankyrin repeat domain-containing protein 17